MAVKRAKSGIKLIITAFGIFAGTLLCVIITLLCTFLFLKSGVVPQNLMFPINLSIAGLGAFFGGYVSGKISKKNGMKCGLATGVSMFGVFFIIGLSLGDGCVGTATLLRGFLMVILGSLGGIIGVNKR